MIWSKLEQMRARIEEVVPRTPHESVAIKNCRGRVLATDLFAPTDLPLFSESLRDGYAIRLARGGDNLVFAIKGELAAGAAELIDLAPGQCCRIFTGAKIPEHTDLVVPYEICREDGQSLFLLSPLMGRGGNNIRRQGSEIQRGSLLAHKNEIVGPELLVALLGLGVLELDVATRPRTAIFCTGSELVEPGTVAGGGQKYLSNGWLLAERLRFYGADIAVTGVLKDEAELLQKEFKSLAEKGLDLVVTTGGMGPGKYDLVEAAFLAAGGEVILHSLPMRPGKAILVGRLDKTVVLGLPGPPHAVRALADELVGPVVLLMQGGAGWPSPMDAALLEEIPAGGDVFQLVAGILECHNGILRVRPAKRLETAQCFIVLPPGGTSFLCGSLVRVHLCRGETPAWGLSPDWQPGHQ